MSEISRQALTKAEFSEMIHEVGVTVGEGENFLDDEQKYPKIAYWEYVWRDLTASGSSYDTVVRYQISYASTRGRDAGLKRLKRALNSRGLHPDLFHEYVKGDSSPAYYYWYCAVDVLEDPLEGFNG